MRAAPFGVGALLALVFLGGSQAVGYAVPVSSPPVPQQAPALTATGDSAPLDLAPPPPLSATTTQPTVPGPLGTSAPGSAASTLPGTQVGSAGIPAVVVTAYRRAEARVAATTPGCHLSWALLAGIGQVESGQADNGDVSADGTTLQPILGPLLNGSSGTAAIRDAGGSWARAEGPMQFLPSTWATWGTDGNGDGFADANNVFDAALAAGHYLCAGSADLNQPGDLRRAILSYNHSDSYLATVLAWMTYFQHNGVSTAAPFTLPVAPTNSSATSAAPSTPSATAGVPTTSPASPLRTSAPPRPSTSAVTGHPSAAPTPAPSASASTGGTPSPTQTSTTSTPSATPSAPATCPSATPTAGTPLPAPSTSESVTPSAGTTPSPSATTCASSSPSPTESPSTATAANSTTAAPSTTAASPAAG